MKAGLRPVPATATRKAAPTALSPATSPSIRTLCSYHDLHPLLRLIRTWTVSFRAHNSTSSDLSPLSHVSELLTRSVHGRPSANIRSLPLFPSRVPSIPVSTTAAFLFEIANNVLVKLRFRSRLRTHTPCSASMRVLNATLMRTYLLAHSRDSPGILSRTHSISNPIPPILDARPSVRPSIICSFCFPIILPTSTHLDPQSYAAMRPSTLVVRLSTVRVTRVLTNMGHYSFRLVARPRAPQDSRSFRTYFVLSRFVPLLRPSFSSRFSAIGIYLQCSVNIFILSYLLSAWIYLQCSVTLLKAMVPHGLNEPIRK